MLCGGGEMNDMRTAAADRWMGRWVVALMTVLS